MVDALVMGCFQTAVRTNPGFLVEGLGFGLNTGDEKHVDIAWLREIALKRAGLANHLPNAHVK